MQQRPATQDNLPLRQAIRVLLGDEAWAQYEALRARAALLGQSVVDMLDDATWNIANTFFEH